MTSKHLAACAALAAAALVSASAAAQGVMLNPGFQPDPMQVAGNAGGTTDAGTAVVLCEERGLRAHFPAPKYCTDNAAMIAGLGHELWRAGRLPVEELVSSTIPLDEINAGMDELAEGRAVRQIIRFN